LRYFEMQTRVLKFSWSVKKNNSTLRVQSESRSYKINFEKSIAAT